MASMPSRLGMLMSMTTRSGFFCLNLFDGHLAVIGFAYDGKVILSGQQVVKSLPEYRDGRRRGGFWRSMVAPWCLIKIAGQRSKVMEIIKLLYRSNVVMEDWSTGVMEYRSDGVLE